MDTDVAQEFLAEIREINSRVKTLNTEMRDVHFVASACAWLMSGILFLTAAIAWVVAFSPIVRAGLYL